METKMPARSSDKVKLSLLISPQLNEALETMAQESGTTKSDILRKAIALLEVALDARKEGKGIGIVTKDRQVVTEIVGV
jgi:regulator of PEP synthase PpsR (kinase-PPPase family)